MIWSREIEGGTFTFQRALEDVHMNVESRLTELAASGEGGAIEEVTSPDDNLQAVFTYLVKQ